MMCALYVHVKRELGGKDVKRKRKLFVKERSGEGKL